MTNQYLDKRVANIIQKDPKARVAYNLQKLIIIPIFSLTAYFVLVSLEYHNLVDAKLLTSIFGYGIPISFGGLMFATGLWGVVTDIHPTYRILSSWNQMGWKPGGGGRTTALVNLIIGLIILYLTFYYMVNGYLPPSFFSNN